MKTLLKLMAGILVLGAFVCPMAEAKKPAKKSSSTASAPVPLKKLGDGAYDVEGHTYTASLNGTKMTITFDRLGVARLSTTHNGKTSKANVHWTYWGYGLYGVYREFDTDPDLLRLEVSDDGHKLYAREDVPDSDPLTFTLVK